MVSAYFTEDPSDYTIIIIILSLTLDLIRVATIYKINYRLEQQPLFRLYLADGNEAGLRGKGCLTLTAAVRVGTTRVCDEDLSHASIKISK